MSLIAILEGTFVESKVCRNQDYFQAVFNFPEEVYGKVFTVEEMPKPKRTNILCETKKQPDLLNLNPGQKYKLVCSVGVRQPNERDGKKYPASVSINILKVNG